MLPLQSAPVYECHVPTARMRTQDPSLQGGEEAEFGICANARWRLSPTALAFIRKVSRWQFFWLRRFLSHIYLWLPHLPRQLSLCASICPVLLLGIKKGEKKESLSKSGHDLNQTADTMSHKQLASFFHSHYIHPAKERYLGIGRGWRVEAQKMWKWEVFAEKGESRSMCLPPPVQTVTHRQKGALLLAFVGPRRRRAEMEEIIAEMRYFFYWGYAGISLAGKGREVRKASSVCLFAPNWSREEDEWVKQRHPAPPTPPKKSPSWWIHAASFSQSVSGNDLRSCDRETEPRHQTTRAKSASESNTNETG